MQPKQCPKCNTAWEEEERIYDFFLRKYDGDEIRAAETASAYGDTPETPKHFGKDIIGIEIQGMYDGISFWKCKKCKTTFNRWTMKEEKIKGSDEK